MFATRRIRRCPLSESEMDQRLGYTAVRLSPARSRPAKVEDWTRYTGKSIFPSGGVCRRAHSGLLESQQRRRVLSERPVQKLRKSSTSTTIPKDHGLVSVFGVRRGRVILNNQTIRQSHAMLREIQSRQASAK